MALMRGAAADGLARLTRMEPRFVVAGFAKCGTTSLFEALCSHPRVAAPALKEINYFNHNYRRGRAWYRRHFPYRWYGFGRITGEGTPGYATKALAPMRIHRHFGARMRLVLSLRNPLERAWSHYRHRVSKGEEEASFMEALDQELRRRAARAGGERVPGHGWSAYIGGGRYAGKLRNIYRCFPQDQVHVLFFEELIADPATELDRIARFLDIEPGRMVLPKSNAGMELELPDQARRLLEKILRPDDNDLEKLLGRPLPWR